MTTLTILGGAREIGANAYHLDLNGTGLLLDAGLHPRLQGKEALPLLDAVSGEVDAILITHAHLDHVGALPLALRAFHRARVYMTDPTSRLALRMLRNAVSLSRAQRRDQEEPLFGHDEVNWVEQVVHLQEPGQTFKLNSAPGEPPRITFLEAGHLLGAVGVLIEHGGRRIFYSGDTCAHDQHIVRGATYPEGPLDLLILDSTHGADPAPDLSRDQRAYGEATRDLAAFIRETYHRGGSVLMPVFAMGRAQELLGLLHHLRQHGGIPEEMPVHLSGLAHAVARIYDDTRGQGTRCHPELCLGETGYLLVHPERISDPALLNTPGIFAVTSGMMIPGTSSHRLARILVRQPRNGVAFVGYLDPETVGHTLANTAQGGILDLGGPEPIHLACPVSRFDFTAHSRASQLLASVEAMQPARVVLVHGDGPAVERMALNLSHLPCQVTIAEPRMRLEF